MVPNEQLRENLINTLQHIIAVTYNVTTTNTQQLQPDYNLLIQAPHFVHCAT